ncbi:ribonuclease D [Nakamurella sp. A5-74]|uniref:Ribonuclease D n=1 Tax=Nakamurella sp. A5-74 TaxID=3158264 RepID=A0AAU8DV43_9ACTN
MLAPRTGFRGPLTDRAALDGLAAALSAGTGSIALDTERASGFRYSQRAQLIQLRREDVGTVLLDPIALGDLSVLTAPLARFEWVLHAASQDLPCLAEENLLPGSLFDTELAGRLAGLPRVGLGPLVESQLGLSLSKGHGADDWSVRPLPQAWLIYAALDVEVLIELQAVLTTLLEEQGKWEWARQEFAALAAGAAVPTPPRVDPWRRTSGIHKIKDRRVLAIVSELWTTRDRIARERDLAPHRVLPDTAIVDVAVNQPTTLNDLVGRPVFRGRMQRRQANIWFDALSRARRLPAAELPPVSLRQDGPPPASRWATKDPEAHRRLSAARSALAELSEEVSTPVENLLSPALLRGALWGPDAAHDESTLAGQLTAAGARPWQVELTVPRVIAALADAETSTTA